MKGNYIFINTNPITNMIAAMGITPADYVNGLDELPNNIILLDENRQAANGYDSHTRFNLINGSGEITKYLLNNSLHDKKFVDFSGEDTLNNLSAYEISELLYLGHMGAPMGTPFSSKLLNEYIYISQDNDVVRMYYRRFSDFNHILDLAIRRNLRNFHNNRRIFLRPLSVKNLNKKIILDLITKADDGLFINFQSATEFKRSYHIPLRILINPERDNITLKTGEVTENTRYAGQLVYDMRASDWSVQWKAGTFGY